MSIIKKYFSRSVFGEPGRFIYPETPLLRDRFVQEYIENAKRRKKKRSEQIASRLLKESGKPVRRILEVGCGPGYLIRRITSKSLPSFLLVAGVDIEFLFLKRLAKKTGNDSNIFVQNENGNIPFQDGTFDLVICEECLHGWQHPEAMLREMLRVLAPGGRIRIFDINPRAFFFRIVFIKKFVLHRTKLRPLSGPDRWFCHSLLNGFSRKTLADRLKNLETAEFRFLPSSRWIDLEITKRRQETITA